MQIINSLIQGTSLYNLTGKKWFFNQCQSNFGSNEVENYTLNSCCYTDEANGGVITCPSRHGSFSFANIVCNGQLNCAPRGVSGGSYTCNATPNTTQPTSNICTAFDGPASDQLYSLQDPLKSIELEASYPSSKVPYQYGYTCQIAYITGESCTNATVDPATYTTRPYCSLQNSTNTLYPVDWDINSFTCDNTLQCQSGSRENYVCKCQRNDTACPDAIGGVNTNSTTVSTPSKSLPWWVYVVSAGVPTLVIIILWVNRDIFTREYRQAKAKARKERKKQKMEFKEQKRKDRLKELDDRKHGAELYRGQVVNQVQARQLKVNKERAAVEEEGKQAIERARHDVKKAELAINKMKDDIAAKSHELEENKKQMFKATKQELFKLQAEQEEITRQRELLFLEQQDLERKLQRKRDNFDMVMKYSTGRDENGNLVPQIEITAIHTAQTKDELARLPQQITQQNQQFQSFTNNLVDMQRAIGAPPPGTSSGLVGQTPLHASLQAPPRAASQGTHSRNSVLPFDVGRQ